MIMSFLRSDDVEIALLVEAPHVAQGEETAPPRFGRRRRVVEVFANDCCATDIDFPDLPVRNDIPVLVSELDERPGYRLTDGPDLSPLIFRAQIRHQADLGCAVELVETCPRKPLQQHLLRIRQQGRAAAQQQPQ